MVSFVSFGINVTEHGISFHTISILLAVKATKITYTRLISATHFRYVFHCTVVSYIEIHKAVFSASLSPTTTHFIVCFCTGALMGWGGVGSWLGSRLGGIIGSSVVCSVVLSSVVCSFCLFLFLFLAGFCLGVSSSTGFMVDNGSWGKWSGVIHSARGFFRHIWTYSIGRRIVEMSQTTIIHHILKMLFPNNNNYNVWCLCSHIIIWIIT